MSFFSTQTPDAWRLSAQSLDRSEAWTREERRQGRVGSLCAECGTPLSGDRAHCGHHAASYGEDWSATNRVMCAFFHRGAPLPRLPERERAEPFWVAE